MFNYFTQPIKENDNHNFVDCKFNKRNGKDNSFVL